jgi:dTDP-4-amino-4,6-dideoxygalactose transaminase
VTPGRRVNFYFAHLSRAEAGALWRGGLALLAGRQRVTDTVWSDRVEAWVSRWVGARAAVTFPSARSALYALLRAASVGPGDEVIVTGFTCVAVPNPVLFLGAVPRYADIEATTFNAHPGRIAALVTPRTRAIVVQHTFGIPTDLTPVLEVARRHGILVVEDCCLALGTRVHGRPVGSAGDAGIGSFELSKTVSAGWGGVLWLNEERLVEPVRLVRETMGFVSRAEGARQCLQAAASYWLYHPLYYGVGRYMAAALYRSRLFRTSTTRAESRGRHPAGFGRRMADVPWRAVLGQLQRLQGIVQWAGATAKRYRRLLEAHGVATVDAMVGGDEPAWVRYPFMVGDRALMRAVFARGGVELGQWFDSPVSGAADLAALMYAPGDCPEAERVARRVVNLPVHRRLTESDVGRIEELIETWLRIRDARGAHPASRVGDGC